MYYELTYNGDRNEWYLDAYKKFENRVVSIAEQTEPMKTTDYCDICKQDMCENCIADGTNPYCVPSHYEIKQTEQTEPNNSEKPNNCETCRHYTLACDLFSEICKYEPKDEPQTERSE